MALPGSADVRVGLVLIWMKFLSTGDVRLEHLSSQDDGWQGCPSGGCALTEQLQVSGAHGVLALADCHCCHST